MKIRTSFVANSSSASFILTLKGDTNKMLMRFNLPITEYIESELYQHGEYLKKALEEWDEKERQKIALYFGETKENTEAELVKTKELLKRVSEGCFDGEDYSWALFKEVLEFLDKSLDIKENKIIIKAHTPMYNSMMDCPTLFLALYGEAKAIVDGEEDSGIKAKLRVVMD